jgi:hypothetical protein
MYPNFLNWALFAAFLGLLLVTLSGYPEKKKPRQEAHHPRG